MAIEYPGVIPDLLTRFGLNPLSFSSYTDLLRELQALFNTAGVNPQGSGGTIDGRLDAIEAALAAPAKTIITANSTAIANVNVDTIFSNGTVTILGNSPIIGRVWRVTAGGVLSTAVSSPPTLTFKLHWGNTAAPSFVALTPPGGAALPANLASVGWWLSALITVRTVGVSGSAMGDGFASVGGQTLFHDTQITAPTINTTVDTALGLSVQWSTAAAANSITLSTFVVEQVN